MIGNCFEVFNNLLQDPDLFIQGKIGILKHIEQKFDRDYIASDLYDSYADYILDLPNLHQSSYGFKITGMEDYNTNIVRYCDQLYELWNRPVTVHGYLGYQKGSSFDRHFDDCNVWLYVVSGTKLVIFDHDQVVLNDCQGVLINKGVYHRIVNITDNVALSFGHK